MAENNEGKNKEEIKALPLVQPWKIFTFGAFFFFLILILGIFAAFGFSKISQFQKISLPTISFWQFLSSFILATLIISLIASLGETKKARAGIFKTIFVFVILFGTLPLLNLWLPAELTLVLVFLLIFWWLMSPSILIHNLCLILGLAGAGSILGLQLTPLVIVVLLILFSIYDFVAVRITKQMIKMAVEMTKAGAIFALIVPPQISLFFSDLKKVVKPGGNFLILGGGDIAFPLLFCASLVSEGIFPVLVVAIFSFIGLLVGYWLFISQKIPSPIPALPPIALFSIIGFLLTRIF